MKILRELREKRGLTLEQVAEALDSKNQYISNYELGKRRPDYDTLSKFADFYGVSVDFLLGRKSHNNLPTPVNEDGRNTVKIAGRDGSYMEKRLSDEQVALLQSMLEQMKPIDDDSI